MLMEQVASCLSCIYNNTAPRSGQLSKQKEKLSLQIQFKYIYIYGNYMDAISMLHIEMCSVMLLFISELNPTTLYPHF